MPSVVVPPFAAPPPLTDCCRLHFSSSSHSGCPAAAVVDAPAAAAAAPGTPPLRPRRAARRPLTGASRMVFLRASRSGFATRCCPGVVPGRGRGFRPARRPPCSWVFVPVGAPRTPVSPPGSLVPESGTAAATAGAPGPGNSRPPSGVVRVGMRFRVRACAALLLASVLAWSAESVFVLAASLYFEFCVRARVL